MIFVMLLHHCDVLYFSNNWFVAPLMLCINTFLFTTLPILEDWNTLPPSDDVQMANISEALLTSESEDSNSFIRASLLWDLLNLPDEELPIFI